MRLILFPAFNPWRGEGVLAFYLLSLPLAQVADALIHPHPLSFQEVTQNVFTLKEQIIMEPLWSLGLRSQRSPAPYFSLQCHRYQNFKCDERMSVVELWALVFKWVKVTGRGVGSKGRC